MKDFLSKEYHRYKIHTLSMKGIAYPLSIDNYPFLRGNLDPLLLKLFKKSEPSINKEGSHYARGSQYAISCSSLSKR